ncbi:dermonecrotic toxin domain-containing protein [Pseudomonas baetica]|uniref:dermonecrotic toxin domain-containing protein n=1 Tax=Pseudomonas baetica TaxID=674054 RepID=UPI003EEAADDC
MSELQGSNPGVHELRVTNAIPSAIKNASPATLESMLKLKAEMPDWYIKLPASHRQRLKALIDERWRLQGELDELLVDLQTDIDAFAKPLLKTSLQANFNNYEDPEALSLVLEVPDTLIFGINTGATHIRRSSLLAAALHNFEEAETQEGAFRSGSSVLRNDARGSPQRMHAITPARFANLCRRLDIGAQYQTHIKSRLMPTDPFARRTLQERSIASEKAAFKSSAFIARLKGDISVDAYYQMLGFAEGKTGLRFHGLPLFSHRLSLMGFRLTSIVLFSALSEPWAVKKAIEALTPDSLKFWIDWSRRVPFLSGNAYDQFKLVQAFFANGPTGVQDQMLRTDDIYNQSRLTGPLIAYVPDDPDHPLKEYASLTEFMKTLISQLRDDRYQAFFSRFVAQKDKGHFFARVNERLKTIKWQQRQPLDMGPWWRETAIENPNAEPITNLIANDLWVTLYQERRDKIIRDARCIAVPTGDEDAAARWKRLISYLDIGWNVFTFAAMLVPGLNEVVLGIMVAQMLAELAEGVEDWSKGDKEEASTYINGVLINFAQFTLMGAGHVVPRVPVALSPFVENLKPIEVGGKERLWNPDLSPYEHPEVLPPTPQTNELGLYQHDGKQVLRLDDRHYVVTQDPETGLHRLMHPERPDAYQPPVGHNDAGSWKTEIDRPLEWDKTRVLRRLGAATDTLSDESLEHILTVSGMDENALRRMHVEHEVPPAVLFDALERFKVYAQAGELGRQMLAGRIPQALENLVPAFMIELPRWPESRGIALFDGPTLEGRSYRFAHADLKPERLIKLTRAELRAGLLPERVIEHSSEQEIHELLGQGVSSDRQVRVNELRNRLAKQAERNHQRVFETLYKEQDDSSDPNVLLLRDEFPRMPVVVAEGLLRDASPEELLHLSQKRRVSLSLRERGQAAQARVRLSRAYEGLYLESLEDADTRRLALASMAAMPGWSPGVRIEIRGFSFTGERLASVGPEDAPIRKVLFIDETGRYHARDGQGLHLHGADDFYGALLHALPDVERRALGFEIYQGDQLKQALQRSPLSHERFASVLDQHPIRKPAYDPQTMRLRGGGPGYSRQTGRHTPRERMSWLYPALSDVQLDDLLAGFGENASERLKALEAEFDQLELSLKRWVNSAPTVPGRRSAFREIQTRKELHATLRQCWQRTGPAGLEVPGIDHPQMLNLDAYAMGHHLATLPRLTANFDHVTRLSMRNAGVLTNQTHFLKPFRQLRALDLSANLFTGLPPVIAEMPYLEDLHLSDNRIELTHQAVADLKGLTRLGALGLRGNPLRLLPDIGRMPELHMLILDNTGIDGWPTGLFAQPRPRNLYLDLRRNPISQIPDVAPGSFRAELLARTLLSRDPEWISTENLDTLRRYTESVGLDPDRPYLPRGTLDSAQWAEGMPVQWQARQAIWDSVEDEYNSEHFFDEIRRLTQSADFKAGGLYRRDLTAKVWRMLKAMEEDSELRTTIFAEAVARTQCVDGATQLFNVLGMKVLVHEAYGLANPGLIEAELISLAKGKSRLDELERIAEHHIAERIATGEQIRGMGGNDDVAGSIDVVEVHLAFTTELAGPEVENGLDLPWQARTMQFRNIAGVTRPMIENARMRVLALEEGDLLRDSIAQQPFWKTWVEGTNRVRFKQFDRRMNALYEYKTALDERAAGSDLPPEDKDRLKTQIRILAFELGKPESDFAPGRVMTDDEFTQQYLAIKTEREMLLKQLTQQAMDRAKLSKVETPF